MSTMLISKRRPCPKIRLWRSTVRRPGEVNFEWGPPRCSLKSRKCHHSPTGIEWGCSGSGPADLALSILAFCLPLDCDGLPPVRLYVGKCSAVAWDLHQAFKRSLIAPVPREGIVYAGSTVDAWIDGALEIWLARREEGEAFIVPPPVER